MENNFGVSIVPTSLQKGYDMSIQFIELDDINLRTRLQMIWKVDSSNPILKNILDLV